MTDPDLVERLRRALVGYRVGLIQFWGSVAMRPDDNVFVVRSVELVADALEIRGTDAASGHAQEWLISVRGATGSAIGDDRIDVLRASSAGGSFGTHTLAGTTVRVTDESGTREYPATMPALRFRRAIGSGTS